MKDALIDEFQDTTRRRHVPMRALQRVARKGGEEGGRGRGWQGEEGRRRGWRRRKERMGEEGQGRKREEEEVGRGGMGGRERKRLKKKEEEEDEGRKGRMK